jgi:membrane glycosyltransferase
VVLFCWTSVWFWQAAAFAFAKAMVERDPGPTGHV